MDFETAQQVFETTYRDVVGFDDGRTLSHEEVVIGYQTAAKLMRQYRRIKTLFFPDFVSGPINKRLSKSETIALARANKYTFPMVFDFIHLQVRLWQLQALLAVQLKAYSEQAAIPTLLSPGEHPSDFQKQAITTHYAILAWLDLLATTRADNMTKVRTLEQGLMHVELHNEYYHENVYPHFAKLNDSRIALSASLTDLEKSDHRDVWQEFDLVCFAHYLLTFESRAGVDAHAAIARVMQRS